MNSETSTSIVSSHSPKKHIKRFGYALNGLFHVILNEANFRVHLVATLVVSAGAYYLKFSYFEWLILILTIGFVLVTEMINSLTEELVDHLVKEHHEGVRIIKDVAAASVLVSVIISLFIGSLLFIPKLAPLIYNLN